MQSLGADLTKTIQSVITDLTDTIKLVGDTANGGVAVFQSYDEPLTVTGLAITPTEGQEFNTSVATFTDADPNAGIGIFSATINWGDGTPPVTVTSTASANGQIVADSDVPGQFDVEGIHTYTEEGQFNVQVTVTDTAGGSAATTASYRQVNLVTDSQSELATLGFDPAAHTDTNLVNPWGLAFAPSGPFWVADNGTGLSTLYDASGTPFALQVTIPASANSGATTPAPVTSVLLMATVSIVASCSFQC